MRMRDRRAPLAVLVLATAYLALGAWGMGAALHWLTGIPPPPLAPLLHVLLSINAILLAWRLVIRGSFTALAYGRCEDLWADRKSVVSGMCVSVRVARGGRRII